MAFHRQTTKEWNCLVATWLILLAAFVIRLIISSHFLLAPDEANYWQWSRHPALCYHDHPPMIAWAIRATTRLLGHTELAVRLPTVIGMTLANIYLCLLAVRWFSCRCAFHVTLLFQAILLFNGAALIATPDGLLIPCWAAACYHSSRALERYSIGHWLMTGLWFGLGMLSKYTMVLFLPSLFFCMLAEPAFRRHLRSPWPWTGLLLGLFLLTPVIYWNINHDWATFRHVLYQGGANKTQLISLRFIGDYLGTQLVLLSPPVFLMLLVAWFSPNTRRRLGTPDFNFLFWTSATTFFLFLLLSFHVRIYGNWPIAGYLSGVLLLAALYSPGKKGSRTGTNLLWNFMVGCSLLMTLPVLVQVLVPALPLSPSLDRAGREIRGWDQLASAMSNHLQRMPDPANTFLFGVRYQYASELAFYMPGQPETVSINRWTRPNVYDYWTDEKKLLGRDAVGVYEWAGMENLLSQLFDHIDPPQKIELFQQSPWLGKQVLQTLYIIRAYGFKGGIRWIPRNKKDIRAVSGS